MGNIITAIVQQKHNPQRVNIYLDGAFAFPLAKIVAAWLKVGQTLTTEKITQLRGDDEIEAATQRAINFISYRPRSTAEVEQNLRKHETPDQIIPLVLEKLKAGHLLDDTDFAQRWVENRSDFRPRGSLALRVEMKRKGLPEAIIEEILQGLDEPALARAAAESKLRQLQGLDWNKFRSKLSAFLSRRGFGYEVVADTVREAWQTTHAKEARPEMR